MSGDGAMRTWYTHELHPLCTLFPRMAGAEFDALVADIAANGLQNPIVLHDGMVLDGGNRYRACQVAGVEPQFIPFAGGDIVRYVLSANLHRRHLAQGQAAAITSLAQDWGKAQTHGGARPGAGRGEEKNQVATLPLETIKQRAAESGASERTQRMADQVAREAPELAVRVAHGEISLPKAVEQITPRRDPPVDHAPAPRQEPIRPQAPVREERARSHEHELQARIDELEATVATLSRELDAATKDNIAMGEAFDANDKLAVLHRQNKELREVNRVLQSRLDGEINTNSELKRQILSVQRKLERMEKARG